MKFNMFSGDTPDKIVMDVNNWLSQQTGVVIRHTETKFAINEPKPGAGLLLFSVWYDEDAP